MKELSLDILFSPPGAFVIVLAAAFVLSYLISRLSPKPGAGPKDKGTAYACGEPDYNHVGQPDYSVFFPFAFFFTIAHVATMIMTTVPGGTLHQCILAVVYVAVAAVGLYILMRE